MSRVNSIDNRPAGLTERLFMRRSLARQGLLGIAAVLIDIVIYAGLVIIGINHVLATIVGSFLGIRTNYTVNDLLIFRMSLDDSHTKKLTAFAVLGTLLSAGSRLARSRDLVVKGPISGCVGPFAINFHQVVEC